MPRADDVSELKLLGAGSMPRVGAPSRDLLEAFPNKYPDRNYVIEICFPEFTSLCPVTGQPDFGTIRAEYIPDALCVESKSFKLYMFAYRDCRSFMETITNSVLDDLEALLKPRWCRVSGLFAPRGGTRIRVFAETFARDDPVVREVARDWKLAPGS